MTVCLSTEDLDKIFRGTNEVFRLKMLDPSFETPQELETAIKNLSADFSDFVIYCNFEGRECNERYFIFLVV